MAIEFRRRLAEESCLSGKLLASVLETVPRLTQAGASVAASNESAVVGSIAGALAFAWLGGSVLSLPLCLGISVAGGMTCAVAIGLVLPALLRRLRWDARVAAGPVARALSSTAALMLYFFLATKLVR